MIAKSGALEGPSAASPARDAYWDAARGIAIIAVIWIHSSGGQGYAHTNAAWNFYYWVAVRQFLNFPVALFLFLAGMFVNPAKMAPSGPWMRSRALRLLVPYLVWSTAFGGIGVLAAGGIGSLWALLVRIALGLTAAHLYFIVVLVQLTVITPLLVRVATTPWWSTLFVVTPAYWFLLYGHAAVTGAMLPLYNYIFAGWFAFYYAGICVRLRRDSLEIGVGPAVFAIVVALLASLGETSLLVASGLPIGLAISQLKATSVLYAFTVFALALALKPRASQVPRALANIGVDSYGIYYVHMVWIIGLSALTSHVQSLVAFPVLPVLQLAQVAVALMLSLFTIWATRRILGRQNASMLLGF